MATAFLEACVPRWQLVVRQAFVDAVEAGAADPVAVVSAVRRLAAEDLERASSYGDVSFYESLLALLAHHRHAALQYAQTLLAQ
jgi:hypothetical protein